MPHISLVGCFPVMTCLAGFQSGVWVCWLSGLRGPFRTPCSCVTPCSRPAPSSFMLAPPSFILFHCPSFLFILPFSLLSHILSYPILHCLRWNPFMYMSQSGTISTFHLCLIPFISLIAECNTYKLLHSHSEEQGLSLRNHTVKVTL